MFEYKVAQFEGTGDLQKLLNIEAEDEWRLVHVFERHPKVYFVFEREKKSLKSTNP